MKNRWRFAGGASRAANGEGVTPSRARWRCPLRWWLIAWLLGLAAVLGACAAGPKLVNHAFGFDARIDSPDQEVLAFRYGDGKGVSRSSDNALRDFGRSPQVTGINGPMPLGEALYVKWRDKATGQTYEDTVDLRPLLPRDMTRQELYFVVAGPQLYVYLIDPVPRPADWPVVGPKKFQNEKIRQIYPH
jgi:hypothetical protein